MSGYRLVAPLAVLAAMLSVHDAHASGPLPSGRASFAIVEDAAAPTTLDIKPAPGATQAFPSLSGTRSAAPAAEPSRPHPPPAPSTNAPVSPAVFPEFASAPRSVGAERDRAVPDVPARHHDAASRWMLSVEGATRAPVDVSIQGRLETPGGLRLGGGYGWLPSSYLGFVTNAATVATDTDSGTGALAAHGYQRGRSWHAVIGLRPFHNTGVYLDAGYAELRLGGSIKTSALAGSSEVSGAYSVATTIRMWMVELGYQAEIADRVVLAVGVGVTGALSSHTTATAGQGTALPQQSVDAALTSLDDSIQSHLVLPTLDARLGFDLI